MEQQRKRVDSAISAMIDDIYNTHLRRMHSNMHLCAAKCCHEEHAHDIETVQTCIEDCADPMVKAQGYLQHELGQFQGRLQNCVMDCRDNMEGRRLQNLQAIDLNKMRYEFERCMVGCVDKHLALIPNMMKTIKTVLAKGPNAMTQA